jgi:ribonuclease P protein component
VAAYSRPDDGGRRLPRERRITRSSDIREILRRGKRSGTAHLDVFDSPSPVAHPRVGVIVPKHRHGSVERNLVKRRLREVLRIDILPRLEAAGLADDVIIRARSAAYGVTYAELREEMLRWMDRRCSRGRSS